MSELSLEDVLSKIESNFSENALKYEPYIQYIRFPRYKMLAKDTKIEFDFPFTILIGANGTNKTSVLQALYGCPKNKNIGEYWFTTDVDEIKENDDWKNCIIYGYNHKGAGKVVEAIKTRVNHSDNPDYWEPSRPIKKYGMEIPTEDELMVAGNSSKTRWDLIEKSIIYSDCKEYVSAFDLFFYHFNFERTVKIKSKQDFIRWRSKHLAKVINGNYNEYSFRGNERIFEHRALPAKTCEIISKIMGKTYKEIHIISHTLYARSSNNKPAKTIWMKCDDGKSYSEAFAGTGEARVILLINDIISAPSKSLILIDEPEISLHPCALENLKVFLLQQILKKKHQIVVSSHAAAMVRGLPNAAIKVLVEEEQEVQVLKNIPYQDAFSVIGQKMENKKKIIVEDKLAKHIIEVYLDMRRGSHWKGNLSVQYYSGGADAIIKNGVTTTSKLGLTNIYYILDGDKNKFPYDETKIDKVWLDEGKVQECKIPCVEDNNLNEIINTMSGCEIKLNPSGSDGCSNKKELIKLQRDFINYWERNVFFLNSTSPECALQEALDIKTEGNGKNYYISLAKKSIKGDITGEDIFFIQKMDVAKLEENSTIFKHLDGIFGNID